MRQEGVTPRGWQTVSGGFLVTGPRDILRLASGKRVESCQYRHWMEIQAKEI